MNLISRGSDTTCLNCGAVVRQYYDEYGPYWAHHHDHIPYFYCRLYHAEPALP